MNNRLKSAQYAYLDQDDFVWAQTQGLITEQQVNPLWDALEKRAAGRAGFNFANLAFYLGFAIIVGSVTFFLGQYWSSAPGLMIFLTAAYVAGFGFAGLRFWNSPTTTVPQTVAGIFTVISVLIVPLFVVAVRQYFDINEPARFPGIYEEVPTLVASIFFIYYVRFPFLTAPLTWSLYAIWFTILNSFDPNHLNPTTALWMTVVYGFFLTGCSWVVSRRDSPDFAWWGYLFGALAISIGLNLLTWENDSTSFEKFLFALSQVGLMALSILLGVQVFLINGSLGLFTYLSWITWRYFSGSFFFPFILLAIGLLIMWVGTKIANISKKFQEIADRWHRRVPASSEEEPADEPVAAELSVLADSQPRGATFHNTNTPQQLFSWQPMHQQQPPVWPYAPSAQTPSFYTPQGASVLPVYYTQIPQVQRQE